MALTQKHIIDICMINSPSACCRYLDEDQDETGKIVHLCKKKMINEKKIIDEEIQEFLDKCAEDGIDPKSKRIALGDNCQGYFKFIKKMQGYDLE